MAAHSRAILEVLIYMQLVVKCKLSVEVCKLGHGCQEGITPCKRTDNTYVTPEGFEVEHLYNPQGF